MREQLSTTIPMGELATKLKQILKERGITAILVTHQVSDAKILADRIIKM